MSSEAAGTTTPSAPIRVVFFGTPEYAVPALKFLATDDRFAVTLVVTQPDRPAGRRHRLTEPAVKIAAGTLDLHVYQPDSLKTSAARQPLADADADLFVVAAYGLIFGPRTLAIPRLGCLNLHASLLPRFRGASPISAAILAGDEETGVSLMRMERGLDTGPVYARSIVPIRPDDTTDTLTIRLAEHSVPLLNSNLPAIASGSLAATPQQGHGATLTRPMTKLDGAIDWRDSAEQIERQVRAMWSWPRAWTLDGGQQLQIHRATASPTDSAMEPGAVCQGESSVSVTCGSGTLVLSTVQPAGGKPMDARAWIAGLRGRLPLLQAPSELRDRSPLVVDV